jgi:hypothetical protein
MLMLRLRASRRSNPKVGEFELSEQIGAGFVATNPAPVELFIIHLISNTS